jgi:hypothetical protein
MNSRKLRLAAALAAVVALSLLAWAGSALARESDSAADPADPASASANDVLIFSYAAKFVCQEPIQAATVSFGRSVPLVLESTDVLVHNPNGFAVTLYEKAVLAPLASSEPEDPGKWREARLKPDYAVRLDCDEITKLLTGDPAATFLTTYGIGKRVEGFVVIGIGPQTATGTAAARYAPLDVTAEYVRGSEVLKKDIRLQPWWTWWWWNLPWRLGYPYERRLPVGVGNIDCRNLLYAALADDTIELPEPMRGLTQGALKEGEALGPMALPAADSPPALVALIGRCNKIYAGTGWVADVDYVLVSNKGYWDPNPLGTSEAPIPVVVYPWIPGRWHDVAVVLPQQHNIDLDDYIRRWYAARWTDNGTDLAQVTLAMPYFFPWWCGSSYWWGWGPGDCVDIGVGEGESLDVLQITPVRVFMPAGVWPPIGAAGG